MPRSVMSAVTSSAGVTSNAGLKATAPSGAIRTPPGSVISRGIALFDRYLFAGSQTEIERAAGGRHIKRDTVVTHSTARPYVPILLATSPLDVILSAPTITA